MRILLLDDERFFRDLYAGWLGAAGHVVEVFEAAGPALTRFEGGDVDVVLTDLVMPDTDGLAFVAGLRDRDPAVPIVVVTQREDIRAATEALRLGVDEYLLKPVDRELLVVATERAADSARLRREHRRLKHAESRAVRSEELHAAALALASEVDGDRVQDRFLESLVRLTGAQGAAIWTRQREGQPLTLRGHAGVVAPGSLPERMALDGEGALEQRLRERASHVQDGHALWVPLVREGTLVGAALAAEKLSGPFDPTDAAAARTLADHAAVALRTASRVATLQRAGLRDRETAAYNITYFIDYAGKEIYKARRYGRSFSLVTLQVDNLAVLRSALSEDSTRTVTRALVGAVERIIRDADVLARVTEDTYYVLLPETDHFGARMFSRRVVAAFAAEPAVTGLSVPPSVVLGTATWPEDGEDFDELLMACGRRRDEVRASPYRRLHLEDQPFWDLADTLLETDARAVVRADTGRRSRLAPRELEALLREVARDAARDSAGRGLVYLGTEVVDPAGTLVAGLDPTREGNVRIYLLGREGEGSVEHPSITPVFLPEEARLDDHRFLFWLTERASYALLEGPGERAYHTSDPSLVEALVARLQEAYDLQRQF